MKYLRMAIMMVPVLMVGCLEVETTSKVNTDGSIERSLKLKGSAKDISESKFNIPRKDLALWQVTTDSLGDDKVLYQAAASFESVEHLNQSFKQNAVDPGVQIKASLVLDEGLFFRRYFYREYIWADLPGTKLPMEPYLSQSELEMLIAREEEEPDGPADSIDSDRLEHQWELYMKQLIYEDFIVELREGAQRSGHLSAIDGMLVGHSDSLMETLSNTNFYDDNPVWKLVLENYIDAEIINNIEEANTEGFVRFYDSWQFFEDILLDSYMFNLELPGVIQHTSTGAVQGNLVSWEPVSIRLFFGGIAIEAESSKAKPGAIIFAGLLLVLTVILILAWSLRPRKGKQAV